MKRLLIGAALLAFSSGVASAQSTSAAHPAKSAAATKTAKAVVPPVRRLPYRVAPADEYFGRLKLSILGIRNIIKDDGLKIDRDATAGGGVISAIVFTEDALHDWESKYPHDSWLPQTLFTLERLYAKIDSDAARTKAKATMAWLVKDFPASPQAKIGRRELAANLVGTKPPVVQAASANADAPVPVTGAALTTAPQP